jgi:EmrB/QacA subfamily drug resistance transporter
LGLWSATAAAGGATGALLGGILTDLLSWRWILFINVPIGAAAIVAAMLVIPETKVRELQRRLDIWGALTITGSLVTLVYAVVNTDSGSWTGWQTLAGLPISAILFVIFIVIETRVPAPLVPLRLFRSRSLTGANLVMLFLSAAIFAMWFFLTLYMQNVLGYSPLRAGFAFLPQTVAIVIGAQISSRWVNRIGARPLLVVGPLISAAGLLWLAQVGSTSPYFPDIAIPGVLITFGLGLSFTPITVAATAGIRREESGLASGIVNTMRQIGGSLGLAILATIAAQRTLELISPVSRSGPALRYLGTAVTAGYTRGFAIGAIFAVAAAAAALIIPPLKREPAELQAAERQKGPGLATGE